MMTQHIKTPDAPPRIDYVGNGETTAFPFPFPVMRREDLTVEIDGAPAAVAGLDGLGQTEGGSVSLATAPSAGARVTVRRQVATARSTDFQEGGDLRAEALNDELDRLTMMVQERKYEAVAALRAAAGDPPQDLTLPAAEARAGAFLAFDDDGKPMAAAGAIDALAVSTAMAPAIAAGSAAGAREVIGGVRVVDVKTDHGAVGDGVADDTAAIQAAMATGDAVYFPPGDYLTRAPLKVRDSQTVLGAGRLASRVIFLGCNGVEPAAPADQTTDVTLGHLWLVGSDAGRVLKTVDGDGAETSFTATMPAGMATPPLGEIVVYVAGELAGQGGDGVDLTPYAGDQAGDGAETSFNWRLPGWRTLADAGHLTVRVDGAPVAVASLTGVGGNDGAVTLAAAPAEGAVVAVFWTPAAVTDAGSGSLQVDFLGGYAPAADDEVAILWAHAKDCSGVLEARASRWSISDCFIQDFTIGRETDGARHEVLMTETVGDGAAQSWAWSVPAAFAGATIDAAARIGLWREVLKATPGEETRRFDLALPGGRTLDSLKHLRVYKNGVLQRVAWGETIGGLHVAEPGRLYASGTAFKFDNGGGFDAAYTPVLSTDVDFANDDFDDGSDSFAGWRANQSGAPGVGVTALTAPDFTLETDATYGNVARITGEQPICWDEVLEIAGGKVFRLEARVRQLTDATNGSAATVQRVWLGIRKLDESFANSASANDYGATSFQSVEEADGWVTISKTFDYASPAADEAWARPLLIVNDNAGDGVVEVAWLRVYEIVDGVERIVRKGAIVGAVRDRLGWGYRSEPTVTIDQTGAATSDGVGAVVEARLNSYRPLKADYVIDGIGGASPSVTFTAAAAPQAGDDVRIMWREPQADVAVVGVGDASGAVATALAAPASGAAVEVWWEGSGYGSIFNNAYNLYVSQQNQRRNPNNAYPLYGWRAGGARDDGRTEVCGWFGGHAYGELLFARTRGDQAWSLVGDGAETQYVIDLPGGSSQLNAKRLTQASGLKVMVDFQRQTLGDDYEVTGVGSGSPKVTFAAPPADGAPIEIVWIDPNGEASVFFKSGQGNSAHGVGVGGAKYGFLFDDRHCSVSGGYVQIADCAVGFTERAQFNRVDGSIAITETTVADLVEDMSQPGYANFFGEGAVWPTVARLAGNVTITADDPDAPVYAGLTAAVRNRRRQGRRIRLDLIYSLATETVDHVPGATFRLCRWDPVVEDWIAIAERTVSAETGDVRAITFEAVDAERPYALGWASYRVFAHVASAADDTLTLRADSALIVEHTNGLS